MHVGFKLGGLLLVTMTLIFVFSVVYWKMTNKKFTEALYTSALIQTLNGKTDSNGEMKVSEKMAVSVQSILAYMITSGLLIVSFSIN